MSHSLVIDQGTHASRAIIFDEQGQLVEQQTETAQLHHLDHLRIEQSADELLYSVQRCLDALDDRLLAQVSQCALCTQRSTIVAWHRSSGAPLHPAISWQDRRSEALLQPLQSRQARIHQLTGLPLSAHYGAGKLRWLLENVPAVQQAAADNQLCIGPLASFLLYRLCAERPFVVDHSNAHRMLLLDIQSGDWSDELLQLFNIDRQRLPRCQPVLHTYGHLSLHSIPVNLVCGDQTAALYAHGEPQPGSALINLGTGGFVLTPLPQPVDDPALLCSLGRSTDDTIEYLLEGTVNGAGAALSWLQDRYPAPDIYRQLPHWLATPGEHKVLFINTVGGLGSPWWHSAEHPCFIHDQGCSLADRYVAVIDSIAFLIVANIQRMQQHTTIKTINVGGGLSILDGLCQRIADLSHLSVSRLHDIEASAYGALLLMNERLREQPQKSISKQFAPKPYAKLEQAYKEFIAHLSAV